ncbi:MAG: hypothetical protein P8P79_15050 [Halioglobus sp.]|nr:hypothetical protein [Halioglobus sp.]
MKSTLSIFAAASLLAVSVVTADTLELADGTLLEGDMVGSSNGIIMFNTGDDIEAYPESEVVGIYLSEGVATRQQELQKQQNQPQTITVAEGTRLVIRMSETIDTKRHSAGYRFRGQLESALVVNGITAARRGTTVYGRILGASQSGRLAGSSDMTIEFTDLLVDDQMHSMRTQGLKAQGKNEAGRTAGRTARAAALGGLYGGSSSAKKGAKVGLGAAILTSGSSINIPAGTLVETNLATALNLPYPG